MQPNPVLVIEPRLKNVLFREEESRRNQTVLPMLRKC